jgi:hypothetical protein
MFPLMRAAQEGHDDLLRLLIDAGADVRATCPVMKFIAQCACEAPCVFIGRFSCAFRKD